MEWMCHVRSLPSLPSAAQVLDPLALPFGRELPEGAAARLGAAQQRASLPCADDSYDPLQEVIIIDVWPGDCCMR
jgi:hypothetical protein